MKGTGISKLLFTGVLLLVIFIISGCKKESAAVKQVAPVTITGTEVDSANYFKGTFGNEVVKFEGNAQAYASFVDLDSAHNGSGNGHDQDAYYVSGSKWVKLSPGLESIDASLELRSLSVRVFVSPIASTSVNFYNLLTPDIYPVAENNGNDGAYITLHDKNGVLWTSKGDQDGSSLIILTRGANMNTYTVLSGIINAKLYDGEHNMKKLTGASFTAAVGL